MNLNEHIVELNCAHVVKPNFTPKLFFKERHFQRFYYNFLSFVYMFTTFLPRSRMWWVGLELYSSGFE